MAERILIIDDEPDLLSLLEMMITERTDYIVETSSQSRDIPKILERAAPDLAMVDLKMPEMDGMEVLELIKKEDDRIPVIILTAYGTIPSAVEAIHKGAFDYITKPFTKEQILRTIDQAVKWSRLQKENSYLRRFLEDKFQFQYLMGTSPAAQRVYRQVREAAQTDAPVLLKGEMGTGKELTAKAIHFHGPRSRGNFMPLYCGFLLEDLVEIELFGCKEGATESASRGRIGLVEKAHQGTLFIDEIGSLNYEMQHRLSRLLRHGEFEYVQDTETHRVNVRLIASTSENLMDKVNSGKFLKELYYQCNVIEIFLPPLRERKQDIPVLVDHFLKVHAKAYKKNIHRVAVNAMQWLLDRDWEGNIRELENVVERGVVLAKSDTLELEDLFPAEYRSSISSRLSSDALDLEFKEANRNFQTEYLKHALTKQKGDVCKAAETSGLSTDCFCEMLDKAGIDAGVYKAIS